MRLVILFLLASALCPALAQASAPSSGTPVYAAIIIGGIIAFVVLWRSAAARSARRGAVLATGYVPPVEWAFVGQAPAQNGGNRETRQSLTNTALLEERAAMSPFMLWYHQSQYKTRPNPEADRWLSVMDGNPALGTPGADLPVYVQIHEHRGVAGPVTLFRVTAQTVEDMTRGPLRKIRVPAERHSDGRRVTITIPAGAAGAPMPRAPAPVSIIHGAAGEGSGDADAERA